MKNLPALLVIMDGYGLLPAGPGNAVALAKTPHLDALFANCPNTTLNASAKDVGLPEGQMGNSEVGHLNIGAGRIVHQELSRIDNAIEDGSINEIAVLNDAIDAAVRADKAVHFMGLTSDGGVHSTLNHFFALARLAKERGAKDIRFHAFMDGRDVAPTSGVGYLEQVEAFLSELGVGQIATVCGRFYAMDRDNRWDRVERAWHALCLAEGDRTHASAVEAAQASYDKGVTDEFIEPVVFEVPGRAQGINDGDAIVFFNFRPDRAREITRAFVCDDFDAFERPKYPQVHYCCLTEYSTDIPAPVVFPKTFPERVLADYLSELNLKQFHIAETEKYAHVTFFLNGGLEAPKEGEERCLIASPKVATYDMQPEMSAPLVGDALVEAIQADKADVYIVNFANCDMVGHTGVLDAAIAAVEAVDAQVGRVVKAIRAKGGIALITADHGNAEKMFADDGSGPHTAHTLSPVPLIFVPNDDTRDCELEQERGRLADIAPTLVDALEIAQPKEWTGRSLLYK